MAVEVTVVSDVGLELARLHARFRAIQHEAEDVLGQIAALKELIAS